LQGFEIVTGHMQVYEGAFLERYSGPNFGGWG
jgi:hypothetical protein